MAAYFWDETNESGSGTMEIAAPTSERTFLLTGPSSMDDIITAIASNLPPYNVVAGLPQFLKNYKYDTKGLGNITEVTGNYGNTPGYIELSGDTGGGKTKCMTALATLARYDCTGDTDVNTSEPVDAPDVGLLIGVNKDKVEGVDIGIPSFDFAVIYKQKIGTMPAGYIQTLRETAWHTNATTFQIIWMGQILTFQPEELLYMGGTFKLDSAGEMEITYKFSAQISKDGGTVSTISFTQPVLGGTVTVTVDSTVGYSIGQIVYVVDPATQKICAFSIGDVIDGNNFSLTNIGQNSSAPTVGSTVGVGMYIGLDADPIAVGKSGPITKKGWHYLWTYAEPRFDSATQRTIPKPIATYVQKVYPTANLAVLGIGASANTSGSLPTP